MFSSASLTSRTKYVRKAIRRSRRRSSFIRRFHGPTASGKRFTVQGVCAFSRSIFALGRGTALRVGIRDAQRENDFDEKLSTRGDDDGAFSLDRHARLAQQRGGRGFGFGSAALLSNKGVQKELKLDAGQITKVEKIAEDIQTKQREAMQGLQDLDPTERRAKFGEIATKMNAETDKATRRRAQERANGSVQTSQSPSSRHRRLQRRRRGGEAEIDRGPEDEDQGFAGHPANPDARNLSSAQDDREGAMKKITALRTETKDKVVALLSADQKKTWETLVGSPFEYKPEPPPGQ